MLRVGVGGPDLGVISGLPAIASDFRVDGAKSPEIPQQEGVFLGSEIAARNRRSLATFHCTLKSQCSIAFSSLGNRCDFWGPRWASLGEKLKGRLLKGSFDKACALTCRFLRRSPPHPPTLPTPLPLFPYFPEEKPPPATPPQPDPKPLPQGHQ